MSRSKHKQVSVPESVLIVLLSGNPVTIDELSTTLQGKIVPERIATYMWDLKKLGAVVTRNKVGNKITSYTLTNPTEMINYLLSRKNLGANIPDLPAFHTTIVPAAISASTHDVVETQELVTA